MAGEVHGVMQNTQYIDRLPIAIPTNSKQHDMASPAAPACDVQHEQAFADIVACARSEGIRSAAQGFKRRGERLGIEACLRGPEPFSRPPQDVYEVGFGRRGKANRPVACVRAHPVRGLVTLPEIV